MNKIIKLALITPLLLVATSCGDNEKDFDFFTVEKVQSKFLELIIEASGSVEAISSIEIKSKAC